jgi:hypothetical protein
LDPIWDAIEIDTPESFERTFKTVNRSVALLYAAHFCQSEVCNGGFTQLFRNSTGVLAPEAVEGFLAIGQPGVSSVVQNAIALLGSPFKRHRASRWSILAGLSSNPDPRLYQRVLQFEPLEREFYTLLESEAGGFESAADRYAERISI